LHLRYKRITIQILLNFLNSIYKEINKLSLRRTFLILAYGGTVPLQIGNMVGWVKLEADPTLTLISIKVMGFDGSASLDPSYINFEIPHCIKEFF
jgi:hypothetical protein